MAKSASHLARYKRGYMAEQLAAFWLQLQGWRVQARRWRSPYGEIDLVMQRGKKLAFIEVKARTSHALCIASVSAVQQQRIASAAIDWQRKHPAHTALEAQLDLVMICPWRLPKHLAHAWQHTHHF